MQKPLWMLVVAPVKWSNVLFSQELWSGRGLLWESLPEL